MAVNSEGNMDTSPDERSLKRFPLMSSPREHPPFNKARCFLFVSNFMAVCHYPIIVPPANKALENLPE
jgi:hypothetical protein